jgi:hypothetical protein
VKTPNFVTIMLACTLASSLQAPAADPYDGLAWIPVTAAIRALPGMAPGEVTLQTFRRFFRRSPLPELRELVKACGAPAEEWDTDTSRHPDQSIPAHLPMSYPGHLFRYNLHGGGHVYIWTGESDIPVMRADYVPASGPVAPLYSRPL